MVRTFGLVIIDRLEDSLSVVHDINIASLRVGDIDRLEDSLSVVHDMDLATHLS